jgi:iron complex outermembrane receptor protein
VLDAALSGRAQLAGMDHRFTVGLMATRFDARFNRQAYNWVGVGHIDGSAIVPADPTLTDENTNRDERSTELRLQDQVALGRDTTLWAGLRSSRIERASVRTNGSRPTDYDQTLTTPWLALSHQLSPSTMAYVSWGQGVESEVAPNRARYTNRGQPLPALKSRQLEAGLKHRSTAFDHGITIFDIRRPVWADIGSCDDDGTSRLTPKRAWARGACAAARCGCVRGARGRQMPALKVSGLRTCRRSRSRPKQRTTCPHCPASRCWASSPTRATAPCCPTTASSPAPGPASTWACATP